MKNASQLPDFNSPHYDASLTNNGALKRAVRRSWQRNFGDVCQSCECIMLFDQKHQLSDRYATIDHINARALGGKNDLSNMQVICKSCNNQKSKEEGRQCQEESR